MFEWLIGDTLLTIIIILAVVALVVWGLRNKNSKPIVQVILAVALLIGGGYSGIKYINYTKTQNTVIGEPVIVDPYENFNFYEYDLQSIAWYEAEDGTYYYEETYQATIEFDGTVDKYDLLLNNTPCDTVDSTAGKLHGTVYKRFRNIDGEVTDTVSFDITFSFYSSKIDLKITTTATADNIGLVREMINVHGWKLRIIEAIY